MQGLRGALCHGLGQVPPEDITSWLQNAHHLSSEARTHLCEKDRGEYDELHGQVEGAIREIKVDAVAEPEIQMGGERAGLVDGIGANIHSDEVVSASAQVQAGAQPAPLAAAH